MALIPRDLSVPVLKPSEYCTRKEQDYDELKTSNKFTLCPINKEESLEISNQRKIQLKDIGGSVV